MFRRMLWVVAAAGLLAAALPATAAPRIALVIGNAAYARGALNTALGDAGLVAEALNSAGFEIVEGADLDQAGTQARFRDFLAKVEAAGPEAVAFVYYSGYGLEFAGENYMVPVDARLQREADIAIDAVRLSDLLQPLAAAPLAARIVALDVARPLAFDLANTRLADGLAALSAPPGMLVAMAGQPGAVVEDGGAAYGAYAVALAEMIRQPGLDPNALFTRVRLRAHQATGGRQTPWHVSALTGAAPLVQAAGRARGAATAEVPGRTGALKRLPADQAYVAAIERDALPSYVEYVQAFPRSPHARRIWGLIRTRREALLFMRAIELDTPEALWTYLRRYPNGQYAADAERRLSRLAAAAAPPAGFAPLAMPDVPPPLSGEVAEEAGDGMRPPPELIEKAPALFANLPPPPPKRREGLLPIPLTMPALPQVERPPRPFAAAAAGTPTMSADAGPAPVVAVPRPAVPAAPSVARPTAPVTAPVTPRSAGPGAPADP